MMEQVLNWQQYLNTAAEAAAEGIVMLKNDGGALPLERGEHIAVFGRAQLHYYKSGTGSGGMVNVSHVTDIPEGLKQNGIIVDEDVLAAYTAWERENPYDLGNGWGGEPWSQAEMPVSAETVRTAALRCRRAVVIIGRTAGEEQDNRMEPGSYLLTETEEELLRTVRRYFDKMIVLLNVGNLIDMHFVDRTDPDAVLYVWQGGMTGGTGTADVLTGKVSPSGKLPDTVAYEISDYPSDANFHGRENNIYAEDIYVGYRYFETFARSRVRYPFGFGLSYTTFSVSADPVISEQRGSFRLHVTVRNTGARDGKEVVQVYCEAPQGRLGKPKRVLIGYHKTQLLMPDEAENVRLELHLPASYDDSGVTGHPFCWVLESGEYRLYVGTDVRSASYAASLYVNPERERPVTAEPCTPAYGAAVLQQCSQAMAPVQPFRRMRAVSEEAGIRPGTEDTPLLQTDEAKRRLDALPAELTPDGSGYTLADIRSGKATLEQFIAQLSDRQLCEIVRGEGMGSPRVTAGTASAFGGVTDALSAYGIPAACCSDGPSGMRLDCGTKAFSLPNGTMLASTFNIRLITELFTMVGLEMSANRVDCLLGPGMNIHRHPLNGRNFEYFSEDPYLTGTIAAAELRGLHTAGVEGTVKHCCGNNQETNRHFLNSVVSERALREIYLKGFEIAVRSGGGRSIMTTYGAVNGVWTACSYDLCTQIIRREWGFSGFLMTDWWANLNENREAPDKRKLSAMVRAQNDVYMVCADCADHDDDLEASLADGTLTRAELQRSAMNICRFLLHTRAMKRRFGTDEGVRVVNRPEEDAGSSTPVVFYDIDRELTLPLGEICTDRGRTYAFALDVLHPGWYDVTLTASSEQSELAQIPVTLFCMGTPSGTFTWNGTGGKPVSFTKRVPVFSRYTAVRLYFAQSGLSMESVRFTLVSETFDMATLADDMQNTAQSAESGRGDAS